MNSWANKTIVFGHAGPHPEQYHQAVYNSLIAATRGLEGDEYRAAFLKQLHILAVKIATPGTDLNLMVRKR
jgi:filamentous hemagglutinin